MGADSWLLVADHFGPWVLIAAVSIYNGREERKAARQREVDEIARQDKDREIARERMVTDGRLTEAMTNLAAEVRGMKR